MIFTKITINPFKNNIFIKLESFENDTVPIEDNFKG